MIRKERSRGCGENDGCALESLPGTVSPAWALPLLTGAVHNGFMWFEPHEEPPGVVQPSGQCWCGAALLSCTVMEKGRALGETVQ